MKLSLNGILIINKLNIMKSNIQTIELTGGYRPSEFNPKLNYFKIFMENKLPIGRMISGSKSKYKEMNPDNFVIFNANIIHPEDNKIWHGDIDITEDHKKLKNISKELGEILYVLYESDCRFENEDRSINELIKKSVWDTESKWYDMKGYSKSKNLPYKKEEPTKPEDYQIPDNIDDDLFEKLIKKQLEMVGQTFEQYKSFKDMKDLSKDPKFKMTEKQNDEWTKWAISFLMYEGFGRRSAEKEIGMFNFQYGLPVYFV